jgi:hypothetical protein
MAMRTLVTFEATGFPDESQWTPNGSQLVPHGRSIASTIAGCLREAGLRVSDVEQHEYYGWCFDVLFPNAVEWCLLQYPGPWLLLVRERRPVLRRLLCRGGTGHLETTLRAIDRVLKEGGRFASVQWFAERAYDSGARQGAESPL